MIRSPERDDPSIERRNNTHHHHQSERWKLWSDETRQVSTRAQVSEVIFTLTTAGIIPYVIIWGVLSHFLIKKSEIHIIFKPM